MAAPITPIDPRPFVGFSVTLPNSATVVEMDPQPFSNTKEVLLLNTSATDAALVQVATLAATPASVTLEFNEQVGGLASGAPIVGDIITINGNALTGVNGAQTSGADDFSAPTLATATITVLAYPVTAGITLTCVTIAGVTTTLTGVVGAPGANQFQVDAGNANLVAASINTAINATPALDMGRSTVAANVVTLWGITLLGRVGTLDALEELWSSRVLASSIPADVSISAAFAGAIDAVMLADSPERLRTDPYASSVKNVAWNIFKALTDAGNTFIADILVQLGDTFYNPGINANTDLIIVWNVLGIVGNGVAVSTTTPTPPPPALPERAVFTAVALTGGTAAVPVAADVTIDTASYIPPGSAISLTIGAEGNRNPLGTSTWWTTNPGSKLGIVLKAVSGANVVVNVTFVQNRGYPEGV